VVEHQTRNPKIKGLDPAISAGKEKKFKNDKFCMLRHHLALLFASLLVTFATSLQIIFIFLLFSILEIF
jgi:hypothetical protein